MRNGVRVHYMTGLNSYSFRSDTMKNCTATVEALLKRGLVEACNKDWKGCVYRPVAVEKKEEVAEPRIWTGQGEKLVYPDSDGFWWMNDPNCYGWEVVRVKTFPTNEKVIYRTGYHNPEEIQTHVKEWVKIEPPEA